MAISASRSNSPAGTLVAVVTIPMLAPARMEGVLAAHGDGRAIVEHVTDETPDRRAAAGMAMTAMAVAITWL
jgi:hypothetical protein